VAATTTLATFTATAPAATGSGPDFAPSVHVRQLSLQLTEPGTALTVHWRGQDRYRVLRWYDVDPVDDRSFTDVYANSVRDATGLPAAGRNAQLARNVATVAPDGWSWLDADVMGYAWPLVSRVRSGGRLLHATSGGRRVLRGTIRLAANECAALERGVRTVDLDPATLVPRRVVDRRGGEVERDLRILPRRVRAADTAPGRTIGRVAVRDDRFVRRASAADVAADVAWPISMPASVPAGFVLAHVGHGARGGRLGPEGYMPQSRGVFFAKWTHGLEAIDFTIRPAHGTLVDDWDDNDPFGGECSFAATSEVAVGSATAKYAVGEFGSPRLWWRDGTTLYTLSGPFSAEQLATIARSLAPVAG
jgi:hypothetical protein